MYPKMERRSTCRSGILAGERSYFAQLRPVRYTANIGFVFIREANFAKEANGAVKKKKRGVGQQHADRVPLPVVLRRSY